MREISSFSHKEVVRPLRRTLMLTPAGIGRRDAAAKVIVGVLAAARETRWHNKTDERERRAGVPEVVRLLRNLGEGGSQRALDVANWYLSWCEAHPNGHKTGQRDDERYVPRPDGGRSFREKFTSLEQAMQRLQPKRAVTTDEVLAKLFNGHRALGDSFRRSVLVPAQGLDFGHVTDGELAESVADLYEEIRAARAIDAPVGPVTLLSRYVDWLGEKSDWKMTTRVLAISSKAFEQFRREEASLHPRGADPLTGR